MSTFLHLSKNFLNLHSNSFTISPKLILSTYSLTHIGYTWYIFTYQQNHRKYPIFLINSLEFLEFSL